MRFLGMDTPIFIAHRGASSLAPENTLAAYRLAIDYGMHMTECDVRRTKDGTLVVMHDAQVNRTTDGTGRVSELTIEQIKSLDAGAWFDGRFRGERVPTFEQFLEQVGGRIHPVIELKEDGLGQEVVESLRRHELVEQSLIVSFRDGALTEVHRAEAGLATGFLFGDETGTREAVDHALALGARMLGPWEGAVTREMVELGHANGMVVQAWTVDDRQRMSELLGLGVDAIATNVPLSAEERQRVTAR